MKVRLQQGRKENEKIWLFLPPKKSLILTDNGLNIA